jgi:hypothetical protein
VDWHWLTCPRWSRQSTGTTCPRVSTSSARCLLDEFAARPANDLNELLSRIEIPVQLAASAVSMAAAGV